MRRDVKAADAIDPVVLQTHDERELDLIANANVQAVIYVPPVLPHWFAELALAVRNGTFQVPRTVLSSTRREEVDDWLEINLPTEILRPESRHALKTDILALLDRFVLLNNATRFMLRILTATPNDECGFHVDTVLPGAPAWGLLRVYNGAGTEYVLPANVTSMADFYRYLARRERLERERRTARCEGCSQAIAELEREIVTLDNERSFMKRPDEVLIAPSGSIVAFKHLDIRSHWSSHSKGTAWIHCSPMAGECRLVINITAQETTPPRVLRFVHGIAH